MNKVFVASPERICYDGLFKSVQLRLTDGQITFLPNHAPFIGELEEGLVSIVTGEEKKVELRAKSGFVIVFKDRIEISLVEEKLDAIPQ